jgi:hypothetical protein
LQKKIKIEIIKLELDIKLIDDKNWTNIHLVTINTNMHIYMTYIEHYLELIANETFAMCVRIGRFYVNSW